MESEGARRVMETTCHDTANQYLRFGWSLINQYVVEATGDQPAAVRYVLASVRRLQDTRRIVVLVDPDEVNRHLAVGWKLIDKYVTASKSADERDENLHFVLAWQSDDPPARPGSHSDTTSEAGAALEIDDEL